MKTWRVLGLICALSVGLSACGDSNKKEDLDSTGNPSKSDGGDGGSEDADAEDLDAEMTTPPPEEAGEDAGGGIDAAEACVPMGCRELGANCGEADDGCGGKLDCGMCKGDYETCGGGGKKNVCGCTAATCDSLSSERGAKVCGTIPDGCGGPALECGDSCSAPQSCGGGAAGNQCGCTPDLAACGAKECGTASDGCGGTAQCGTSNGQCSANKQCNSAGACVCKTDLSAFCANKCGEQQTPDGCSVNCGTSCPACAAGDGVSCGSCQCPSPGTCRSGACCVPETTTALCGTATCGTRTNRCGQVVTCGTGTCAAGTSCSAEGRCESPEAAALVGKYAVRAVGFGAAQGVVSRATGVSLVDVYRDSTGRLMIREQACGSAAYTKRTGCATGENCEYTVTEFSPAVSVHAIATEIELDLSKSRSLNGPKDWVRPVQPLDQNVSGWRRGRPSYCPAAGGPPDSSLPGYAPANDTRALGARKPWLPGDGICKCPSEEFMSPRQPCRYFEASETALRTECETDPARFSLPYSSNGTAAASTVTDCRVVDDDLDGLPGTSAVVSATVGITLMATLRSASTVANVMWGAIDTSGAKRHWGVVQDQVGLRTSNVACAGSSLLCGTSSGDLCPGYRAQPYTKENRLGTIDFVSLHDKTPPAGGWADPGEPLLATCQAIYARINDASWFPTAIWSTRYPDSMLCQ